MSLQHTEMYLFTCLSNYLSLFIDFLFPFIRLFVFCRLYKYTISLAARFVAVGGIGCFLICIKNAPMRWF